MTDRYRIADRENNHLRGQPITSFLLYERRPHPVQGSCYVSIGRFATIGHDAPDQQCIRAALARLYGCEDEGDKDLLTN